MKVIITKISNPIVLQKGLHAGTKGSLVSFKCIDDSEYKDKFFTSWIHLERDYENDRGRVKENIAHYIIKNNLRVRQCFDGVKISDRNSKQIDHFNLNVNPI